MDCIGSACMVYRHMHACMQLTDSHSSVHTHLHRAVIEVEAVRLIVVDACGVGVARAAGHVVP